MSVELWCARLDHKVPTPAVAFVIATFPTPHNVRMEMHFRVPVCAAHAKEDLPPGIYDGESQLVVRR